MANLEIVNEEEKSDEENNDEEIEIPEGLPGSKKPRESKKPEPINIPNFPRRRGRPPGSTNSSSKSRSKETTKPEQLWVEIAAFSCAISTAFFAAKIMRDKKYLMTRQEAVAAGTAIVTVAWQYKQFREFALLVNTNSPYAILARGFWPYLSRAFIGDVIQNVFTGLFVRPTTGQQSAKQSKSSGNEGVNGRFTGGNDGRRNAGNDAEQINISANGSIDWRDV